MCGSGGSFDYMGGSGWLDWDWDGNGIILCKVIGGSSFWGQSGGWMDAWMHG